MVAPGRYNGGMANIVLFHSAYGLRPAVHAAADRLRAAGHSVTTPDLYAGRTADHITAALALRDEIGAPTLRSRAADAVADMPPGTVLAGFSLGASYAQRVGAADPRVAGLLLLHGTGGEPSALTPGLPVQLHVAAGDEFEPADEVAAWYAGLTRLGASVEVFEYTGGHLYTDPDLPDFDAGSAGLTWSRAEQFLGGFTAP
jgi:dienelactone hydrolase